ncbi:TasA family protein [Geodermatophilus sp. SYSU D00079]
MSTTARTTTARKIVGSLGVIGAAAAVAGLGTFGAFTDSTTPVSTEVTAGKVDINLATAGATIPVTTTGFVPGDSLSRAVTLSNDGDSALASVDLAVTTSTSPASILTTDALNGLQLALKSCTVPWTQTATTTATGTAYTYACTGGTERNLGTGAAVSNRTLDNPASLAAGGKDYLVFTVSLPSSADNRFQKQTAKLDLTFSAIQRTGTAR